MGASCCVESRTLPSGDESLASTPPSVSPPPSADTSASLNPHPKKRRWNWTLSAVTTVTSTNSNGHSMDPKHHDAQQQRENEDNRSDLHTRALHASLPPESVHPDDVQVTLTSAVTATEIVVSRQVIGTDAAVPQPLDRSSTMQAASFPLATDSFEDTPARGLMCTTQLTSHSRGGVDSHPSPLQSEVGWHTVTHMSARGESWLRSDDTIHDTERPRPFAESTRLEQLMEAATDPRTLLSMSSWDRESIAATTTVPEHARQLVAAALVEYAPNTSHPRAVEANQHSQRQRESHCDAWLRSLPSTASSPLHQTLLSTSLKPTTSLNTSRNEMEGSREHDGGGEGGLTHP